MWRCHEDGVATDTVHVDARTRLDIVQMNVSVLCDDVYHVVFVTNLEDTSQWNCEMHLRREQIYTSFKWNKTTETKAAYQKIILWKDNSNNEDLGWQ